MYGFNEKNKFYEIYRLMIDYHYQQKGFGKEAIKIVLAELFKDDNCKEVYISIDPNNSIALKIYQSLGFKKNESNVYPGEIIMVKRLND